jgi:hypothetical protein
MQGVGSSNLLGSTGITYRRPIWYNEPTKDSASLRGYSSVGRAPPLQGGGQGFEPPYLHRGPSSSGRARRSQRRGGGFKSRGFHGFRTLHAPTLYGNPTALEGTCGLLTGFPGTPRPRWRLQQAPAGLVSDSVLNFWKVGRAAECTRLESGRHASVREFKSPTFRRAQERDEPLCARGGIGRHATLRALLTASQYEFESRRAHHLSDKGSRFTKQQGALAQLAEATGLGPVQ